jgi:hypothetical protein
LKYIIFFLLFPSKFLDSSSIEKKKTRHVVHFLMLRYGIVPVNNKRKRSTSAATKQEDAGPAKKKSKKTPEYLTYENMTIHQRIELGEHLNWLAKHPAQI